MCSIDSTSKLQKGHKGEEAHFLEKRFSLEAMALWKIIHKKLTSFGEALIFQKHFQNFSSGTKDDEGPPKESAPNNLRATR